MSYLFADDVGTPIFKTIESFETGSKLLLITIIMFGIAILGLTIVMFILRKKFGKTKDKDYIELP